MPRVWRVVPNSETQEKLDRDLRKQAASREAQAARGRARIRRFLRDEPAVTRLNRGGKVAKDARPDTAGAYTTGGDAGCVIVERPDGRGEEFVGGDVQRVKS